MKGARMDEETYEKLIDIVNNLSWMIAILDGYCENFEQDVKEIGNLKELVTLIRLTHKQIYGLF